MHSCRGSSHPRDRTQVSYIAGRLFTNQGTSEAHKITYRYTLHILLFLRVDHQFSTVQFSSVAHSCLPLCHPMNRNTPGLPIHHQLPEFTQTHVHQVSHASQTSHPLSFPSPLAPIPPSIRVFSNESTLQMRWPKYWSFSFSIISFKKILGLISFRMDWLDLLAVQGTLKSLLQHHSSKASILWCSGFFRVQLSHPYMTMGKKPWR